MKMIRMGVARALSILIAVLFMMGAALSPVQAQMSIIKGSSSADLIAEKERAETSSGSSQDLRQRVRDLRAELVNLRLNQQTPQDRERIEVLQKEIAVINDRISLADSARADPVADAFPGVPEIPAVQTQLPVSIAASAPLNLLQRLDLNGDGVINFADLNILLANYGNSPESDLFPDFNDDGVVNFADLMLLLSHFGQSAPPAGNIPDDPASHLDIVKLYPGSGFSGVTPQPRAVGDPSARGYEAKAIARWDVVPYQTFSNTFEVGVVAFHINGINRVEMSVNGGEWTAVREMTLNPRTNVYEYWAQLDASDFPDGQIELRAIAYPNTGLPRLLAGEMTADSLKNGEHSMFLSTNHYGSLPGEVRYVSVSGNDAAGDGSAASPFATIMKAARSIADAQGGLADGGTIYLTEGDHLLGTYSFGMAANTDSRWLTITRAPGASLENTRIIGTVGTNGLRTKLVRVHDITVQALEPRTLLVSAANPAASLWIDGVTLKGPGRTLGGNARGGWQATYATDSTLSDFRDGLVGATLQRNVRIRDIGSDAFSRAFFVVNSSVDSIQRGDTDFHPDVYQLYAPNQIIDNHIVYGLEALNASAQGIFARGIAGVTNTAFVNVLMDTDTAVMYSQWRSPITEHVLFWHVTMVHRPFIFRKDEAWFEGDPVFKDVDVRASVFNRLSTEGSVEGISFENNHYERGGFMPGDGMTEGDPGYRDIAGDDFSPRSDSLLLNRQQQVLAPIDLAGSRRQSPSAIGAYGFRE